MAEAVRSLAQRSADAAKDISSLIKQSVVQVEAGSKVADSSGSALREIVTSVKKVADLNFEIASASAEQAKWLQGISKAMSELDSSTQSNAAASEEVAATSEQMSNQAELLDQLVKQLTSVIEGANGSPVVSKLGGSSESNAPVKSARVGAKSAPTPVQSAKKPAKTVALSESRKPETVIPFESSGTDGF